LQLLPASAVTAERLPTRPANGRAQTEPAASAELMIPVAVPL
jgi:hypothetical protein